MATDKPGKFKDLVVVGFENFGKQIRYNYEPGVKILVGFRSEQQDNKRDQENRQELYQRVKPQVAVTGLFSKIPVQNGSGTHQQQG